MDNLESLKDLRSKLLTEPQLHPISSIGLSKLTLLASVLIEILERLRASDATEPITEKNTTPSSASTCEAGGSVTDAMIEAGVNALLRPVITTHEYRVAAIFHDMIIAQESGE